MSTPAPHAGPDAGRPRSIPAEVRLDGALWRVRRAWPEDGRGLPLELEGPVSAQGPTATQGHTTEPMILRGARIVGGEVVPLPAGEDPRLPALAALTANGGTVVSHRPGKRAVVRTAEGAFVKVVRPGRAQGILDGITRAAAFAASFRTPEVLASTDETVSFAALPGRELHVSSEFTPEEWADGWDQALTAWHEALAQSDPADCEHADAAGPAQTPRSAAPALHDRAAEIRVLEQWRTRAEELVGPDGPGQRARAELVGRAVRALQQAPEPTQHAPAHRDLHDKQILWDPQCGPALLDVDTAALAEPALDLGNLRAHARWREQQGLWSTEAAAVVRTRIDGLAAEMDVPDRTLAAYELSTLARLTCLYAFRPAWSEHAAQLREELREDATV